MKKQELLRPGGSAIEEPPRSPVEHELLQSSVSGSTASTDRNPRRASDHFLVFSVNRVGLAWSLIRDALSSPPSMSDVSSTADITYPLFSTVSERPHSAPPSARSASTPLAPPFHVEQRKAPTPVPYAPSADVVPAAPFAQTLAA